jgi:hypothetical protein
VNISRIVDCNLPLERHEYFSLFFWIADSASTDFVMLSNIIKHHVVSNIQVEKEEKGGDNVKRRPPIKGGGLYTSRALVD